MFKLINYSRLGFLVSFLLVFENFCDRSGKNSFHLFLILTKLQRLELLNFSSCKVETSRSCLLNTFIRNFQIIGACNWSYKREWNRKLNTEWENKYKQRNVDSWVECEISSALGWKWHTKRNSDNFHLRYWTKILITKKVWSGPFRDCFKCLRLESSRGIRICFTLESDF